MTRLLWAMLLARRGVALTIAAIAAVAVAAASAGPIYLASAGAAARDSELAAAPPAERVISRTWAVDHGRLPVSMRITERREPPQLKGFDTVTGFQISGEVVGADPVPAWLVQRGGVCARIRMVAGRCVSGAWEVVVAKGPAADLGLRAGSVLTFRPDVSGTSEQAATDGASRLSVVGVYEPTDPGSAYWADREYVTGGDEAQGRHVLFATAETMGWLRYEDAQEIMDFVPRGTAFANPARLRAVAADVTREGELDEATVTTEIPALLDRIENSHRALAEAVALAVVPLVLLCWLVLYLAVVDSAFRRRAEAGLSGLRGVPGGTRWWLGIAEYLVPILVGAPLGLLGGYLSMSAVTSVMVRGTPRVFITPLALAFAVAAVGGAIGVGVVAQRRATAAPVVDLLRRVPGQRVTGRLRPVELVTAALAGAATYQVATGGERAGGLALLAPMLLALAVGLISARLIAPVAVGMARRGLRRGAVSRSLAGVLLARQPGQARLLTMFIVLFGLLGFAVAAADVAASARANRARAELGAQRVLTVAALPAHALLNAVRSADPDGRYAMAVTRLPGEGAPVLAVDSTRLAGVAVWTDEYGPSVDRVTTLLRPSAPGPVRFAGTGLELRVRVAGGQPEGVRLLVRLQPEGDAGPVEYPVDVVPGRSTYQVATPACRPAGCRMVGMRLNGIGRPYYDVILTLRALRQTGPVAEVVGAAELADPARWTMVPASGGRGAPDVARGDDGLRLGYTGNGGPQGTIVPVSTPRPVPLLTSDGPPPVLAVSGATAPWRPVGELRLVAGAGPRGALVDLGYADLAGYLPGLARQPQVWLSEDAPAETVDRLRDAGLAVVGDRSLVAERERQEQRGPALALRFYLVVAVAAVALGLGGVAVVASTERTALAAQLRALRTQGVPGGVVWRVGFGGHAVLTILAAVIGTAVAGLAWWLARETVPLFSDGGEPFYAPAWPHPSPVAVAVLAALLVLAAAGSVATLGLRRAVERGDG